MTQDEIISMAREAGFGLMCSKPKSQIVFTAPPIQMLERFAALVAEATKEKAAKVCEEYAGTLHQWTDKRKVFAAAIRRMK